MKELTTKLAGRLSLLFLLVLLCTSCTDDCEGIDCQSQDAFEFTIKSKTSGNDLVFGNNPQLSEEDIEIFYLKDGLEQAPHVDFGTGSVIVSLVDNVETYHVRALGETDIITIQSKRVASSECCPATTQIEEVTLNGGTVWEDSGVIVLLR